MWNHSTSKPRWDATEPATICFRPRIWTWQFKYDGFGSRFVTRPPQFKWRKRNSRKSKILPLPKIVQFRQRSDWNSVTSLLQSGTGQQTCKKDRLTDTASLAECHTRPRRLTTAAKGHYTTKAFITHEWSAGATNPMRRKSLGGKMARRGSKRRHGKNNTSWGSSEKRQTMSYCEFRDGVYSILKLLHFFLYVYP